MALLNVRSLLNKIFILQDYFTPHNLDFLFLTETWIKEGDLSPFTELVSLNCTFLVLLDRLVVEKVWLQFLRTVFTAESFQPRYTAASSYKLFNFK